MLYIGNERTFDQDILENDKTCLCKIIRHFLTYPLERPLKEKDIIPYKGGYTTSRLIGSKLPLYFIRKGESLKVYEERADGCGYNLNHFSVVGRYKTYVRIAFLGSTYGVTLEQFEKEMSKEGNDESKNL